MTRAGVALAAVAGCAVTFVLAAALLRPTMNLTASMPIGLYRRSAVDRPPRAGDIVQACLPAAIARLAAERDYVPKGPCGSDTAPLLKEVVAVGGDVVDLRQDAVLINGVALPHSATFARDVAGRPLPRIARRRYHLRAGQLWLWTPAPRSWDSRYYGPLATSDVRAFARPWLVLR